MRLHNSFRLRLLLFVSCLMTSVVAFGGVVFNLSQPPYWSGTFCRGSGSAVASGGNTRGFKESKLFVSGGGVSATCVKHWIDPSGEGVMQHVTTSVLVDSTHFDGDSTISFWMEVKGMNNQWYTSNTVYIPVRNFALCAERDDFIHFTGGNSVNVVVDKLIDMNYAISPLVYKGWNLDAFELYLDAMSSVVYVASHGETSASPRSLSNHHQSDYDEVSGGSIEKAYGVNAQGTPSYEDWLPDILGTGLPPNNSTGHPPISLLFLDCCWCLRVYNAFHAALFPYDNIYGDGNANRAVYGYTKMIDGSETEAAIEELMQPMVEGKTLGEGIVELVNASVLTVGESPWQWGWGPVTTSDIVVDGDPNMRLHFLYTGNTLKSPFDWYL